MNTPKSNPAQHQPPPSGADRPDLAEREADPGAQAGEREGAAGADAAANRGSPATPVMKQFQKTRAESGGRP